ncbi:uncharacterized protein VTP21DRAFT_630 [Calcarisporiella thermophila]|uniref:uncharacterized protein n=1 Tax=Calcarisporiella thermophila TaxID=911321 RepID=UPI0037435258
MTDTNELITEHLNFLPLTFVDEVINAVNSIVYKATENLAEFVENMTGKPDDAGMHLAETLLEANVDKNFDLFELYVLKNVFSVPEGTLLKHQQGLDYQVREEEENALDEELDLYRRRIIAAKAFNYRLKMEMRKTCKQHERMKKLKERLGYLETIANEHNVTPLSDSFAFVVDQVKALTNELEEVQKLEEAR